MLTAVYDHTLLLPLTLALSTGLSEGSELGEFGAAVAVHLTLQVSTLALAVGRLTITAVGIALGAGALTAFHDHALAPPTAVAGGGPTGVIGEEDDVDDAGAESGSF